MVQPIRENNDFFFNFCLRPGGGEGRRQRWGVLCGLIEVGGCVVSVQAMKLVYV